MESRPISSIETTEAFYKGHNSESVLAYLLRQDGYYVIITADYRERGQNGAPGARSGDDFITLPDLNIAKKQGCKGFVEVKYKTQATYTNLTGREEHGIGLRKWGMYRKASKEFESPTAICIHEGNTGAILFGSVEDLTPSGKTYYLRNEGNMNFYYADRSDPSPAFRIYTGNAQDRGGMIFFPRSAFLLWGKIAPFNGQIAKQLSLFDTQTVDGGDILFKVLRHYVGEREREFAQ